MTSLPYQAWVCTALFRPSCSCNAIFLMHNRCELNGYLEGRLPLRMTFSLAVPLSPRSRQAPLVHLYQI